MNLLLTIVLSLALTLLLALVLGRLAAGRWPAPPRRPGALWRGADGLAATVGLLLTAAALALLPWPLHPAGEQAPVGEPLLLWAAVEGAFLTPLLPGLLAISPLATRAAVREAQIAVAGRVVVWLAIGAALFGGAGWAPGELPGRLFAALAGLLALPAALSVGPFAAELSLNAAGAEEGLDEDVARLLRFARAARGAALLAALIVASLPPASAAIPPPAALALALALFAAVALALGRYAEGRPRHTLPAALRWCWWRALPLALAAIVYLAAV
jgi:hypothetical protein